jgi:putative phosphoribosyl transferase
MSRRQFEKDTERTVRIAAGGADLEGDLAIPESARGVVLFAHGSGSSRLSPRNRWVASELHRAGLATLLIDLLTRQEEAVDQRTRHLRFDIGLLAGRLGHAAEWLSVEPSTAELPIGCFGASTGAAAALVCAARFPGLVGAVVSRGGRPDLAAEMLHVVRAPTLLIVGGDDPEVVALNERALNELRCVKSLEIVPGATHLFEEAGTLEDVARRARDWFVSYLPVFRASGDST